MLKRVNMQQQQHQSPILISLEAGCATESELNLPVTSSTNTLVATKNYPKYAKYFKMLQLGLPKDVIKTKMREANLHEDFIDHHPSEIVPKVIDQNNCGSYEDKLELKPGLVKEDESPKKSKILWDAVDTRKLDVTL
jgi:hypothetical protein